MTCRDRSTAAAAAPEPSLPIPVRRPLSRRTATGPAVAIVVAVVVVVVVAVVAASLVVASSPADGDGLGGGPRRAGRAAPRRRGDRLHARRRRPASGTIEDAAGRGGARRRSARTCSRSGAKAPPFTLKTPAGRDGEPRRLPRQGGAARVLRHVVPALRRRGAAPARRSPERCRVEVRVRLGRRQQRGRGERLRLPPSTSASRSRRCSIPTRRSPAVTFPDHGTRGPVSKAYGVGYFPTFYVIDPQGRITWRGDGEQPDALLRQQLERAAGDVARGRPRGARPGAAPTQAVPFLACPGPRSAFTPREKVERPADPAVRQANLRRIGRLFRRLQAQAARRLRADRLLGVPRRRLAVPAARASSTPRSRTDEHGAAERARRRDDRDLARHRRDRRRAVATSRRRSARA